MRLKKWDELPDFMKNESVKEYYYLLYKKRFSLILKRLFDIVGSILILALVLPLLVMIGIAIKVDSRGPIIFRQIRLTQYGRKFTIYKFRTMLNNVDKTGAQITTEEDTRVTKVGRFLRKYKLDEIPQLINIIAGDMSFVGTRPEVAKYFYGYTQEMMATLLLPAGVTSIASILFRDESTILQNDVNAEEHYMNVVLVTKMNYNLKAIIDFNIIEDMKTIFKTLYYIFIRKNKEINDKDL